jgi:hypothetical protein
MKDELDPLRRYVTRFGEWMASQQALVQRLRDEGRSAERAQTRLDELSAARDVLRAYLLRIEGKESQPSASAARRGEF